MTRTLVLILEMLVAGGALALGVWLVARNAPWVWRRVRRWWDDWGL